MSMRSDPRNPRWDILLPAAAAIVATLLIALAALAVYAFGQRAELALDGRVLGLAHRIEARLRGLEQGDNSDIQQKTLSVLKEEIQRPIIGLHLRNGDGNTAVKVGSVIPSNQSRSVDLFVAPTGGPRGRPWDNRQLRVPGQAHGRRGRKTLEIFLGPGAQTLPPPIRLLLPASIGVGLGLIALATLGGRLLIRQRYEAEQEAGRRRMEALGRAGAGLAHQLRNPLATIKGSAQLLGERLKEDDSRRRAQAIVTQADRMDRMLGTLLDFARPPAPEVSTISLQSVIKDLGNDPARVLSTVPSSLHVIADPDHLDHILQNLLSNALSLSPEDSAVEISARRDDNTVSIRISDRGPGPGDNPEELFQPYVTHRPDGAGLGLTIARTLAEANEGTLNLVPRTDGGTTAVLTLPAGGSR